MPVELPPIDAIRYTALQAGDESVLEQTFRASFDLLVHDALPYVERAGAAARVVEHAFEHAWADRQQLATSAAFQAFVAKRVHDGAVRERSRHLSVRRMEAQESGGAAAHATSSETASVDESWAHLVATLHAPVRDRALVAREAAESSRHASAAHLKNVGKGGPIKGAIAFGVAAVLIAGGAVWKLGKMSEKDAGRRAVNASTVRVIATKPGLVAIVPLADGSKAALGADSKLYIPEMSAMVRAVKLEGTAQFTIPKGQPRPFEIMVRTLKVTSDGGVVGVAAFAEDSGVTIVARDADVIIDDGVGEKPLARGAAIVVGRDGKTWVPSARAVAEMNGWGDGRLIYSDRTLGDVSRSFVRWYGIPIKVENPALSERTVSINAPLGSSDSAMTALEDAGGYVIAFTGKQMSLRLAKPGEKRKKR